MRQCGPLTAAARVAAQEQFGSGVWGSCDTLCRVHIVAIYTLAKCGLNIGEDYCEVSRPIRLGLI